MDKLPKIDNLIFQNKYTLLNKIGEGSFGEVFETIDNENKKYASKVEDKTSKLRLKAEFNIYKKILNKIKEPIGIPNVYTYIETTDYNILVMDLLGISLEAKFNESNRKFNISTIYAIAIDMIKIISFVHSKGFLHRDIKPNNFLFNNKIPHNKLYIMDFGLSKQYIQDKSHIDIKFDRNLIGTARYASLNIHWGIEPSRRDDLESIGYILIYLFRGKLPWQGLKGDKHKTQIEKIGDKKLMTSLEKLCEGLHKCFYLYLDYCKKLKFETKPDYDYLINLFINSAEEHSLQIEYVF
jgi:serine/threonine protein kinase